jgi:acetoacetate decarboxylase
MHGQLWVSLFRVREGDHPDRAPGVYGAAMVAYEEPSPLTYGELLVATPRHRRAHITDIWVDSVDSRDGGRDLWAIPKDLATFSRTTTGRRRQRTSWEVAVDGRPTASARFTDVASAAPRTPFRGATWQVREDGSEVSAPMRGTARSLPCRARWTFHDEGPLAWLAGKRPLASFRMAGFQMSFG